MPAPKPLSPSLLLPQPRGIPAPPLSDDARLRRYRSALGPLMRRATVAELDAYLDRVDRGNAIRRRFAADRKDPQP